MKKTETKGNNKDVAIWGHPPPPIGGMTVHISRLIPKLKNAGIEYQMYGFEKYIQHNNDVFDVPSNKIRWLLKMLFGKSEKVHYVFTGQTLVRCFITAIGRIRKKKVILRFAGKKIHYIFSGKKRIERLLIKYALRNASAIIGVNKEICKLAVQEGAQQKNVYHIPGFISPQNNGAIVPDIVLSYFSNKNPKLITSGQVVNKWKYDTYGVWMLLDIIDKLKYVYPTVGLVIFSYEITPQGRPAIEELKRELKIRNLQGNVLVFKSEVELWPSISVSDLYIRNSLRDGDANAIREALSVGTPVVASDCVPRPDPVITYSTGSLDELYEKIVDCLNNYHHYKKVTESFVVEDNSEKIVSLFKSLISENDQ